MSMPRRIESEAGAGTPFEILLQRADETPGPDSAPAPGAGEEEPPDAGRSGGTLLLVEDDDVLRTTYGQLLAEQGWEVLAAPDGFNALLRSDGHRGRIDVLVCDIVLPKMSGIELWRKLARFRPETQVLFMTSSLEQARLLLGTAEDAPRVLAKPFTAAALLDSVRNLVAESPFLRTETPPRS